MTSMDAPRQRDARDVIARGRRTTTVNFAAVMQNISGAFTDILVQPLLVSFFPSGTALDSGHLEASNTAHLNARALIAELALATRSGGWLVRSGPFLGRSGLLRVIWAAQTQPAAS
jgi:hypothetical protein